MPTNDQTKTSERLLSVAETAHRLACSERQVWRLLRNGQLKRIRIGDMTRTTEKSIQDLISRS